MQAVLKALTASVWSPDGQSSLRYSLTLEASEQQRVFWSAGCSNLLTAVRRQYGCARATCAMASAARVTVALENMMMDVRRDEFVVGRVWLSL